MTARKVPTDKRAIVEAGLRERIGTHQLLPGSPLSEAELAQDFDVSRGVIREVFTRLEQRGLIKRTKNKSAIVVRLELPEILEIYAIRELLEGLCTRRAAQNVPPESWQDLVDLYDGPMERSVKDRDFETYIDNLQLFRARKLEAAKSLVLSEMLHIIHDRVREIGRRIIVLPGRAEVALREHRAVLEALRRGDPDKSEELQRANIRSSCEYLQKYERFVL
jgi:DNA-binding GntR family transcriptional regulator